MQACTRRFSAMGELEDDLANDVIVVENPPNAKATAVAVPRSACHLADTLNSQLFFSIVGGGNEHFDSNIGSDGRAPRTANKSSIERKVVCKSTLSKLAAIAPMEDDGEMQPVSHS